MRGASVVSHPAAEALAGAVAPDAAPGATPVAAGPSAAGSSAATPATRAAILAAARSLALDVGFRRTTVADVARRAGVSRTTVYREFPDLTAIWSQVLTDELVGQLVDARLALADLPTARSRIVAIAATLVERIPQHPLFRRALDVDPQVLLPLIVTRFGSSQQALLRELDRLLAEGRRDGSVRADLDAQAAAAAILLTAQSFVFSSRAVDSLPDPAGVRGELPPLLDRYLAA